MSLVGELITSYGPETSVILLLSYELFWPLWDTKLQNLVKSISDDVEEQIGRVEEKLDRVDEKQVAHIQVTRAMARDSNVSNERVDDYLVENGVTIDYFFGGNDDNPPRNSADD